MKAGVSTVGGSMYENSLALFERFGIKPARRIDPVHALGNG